MAGLIAQGGTITLEALTSDNTGAATDASALTVSIIDATGTTVVSNASPTHVSTGHYEYAYPVSPTAVLGAWAAEWVGTVGGFPLISDDGFTVVTPPQIITPTSTAKSVGDMIGEVEDHLLSGDRDELNSLATPVTADDTTLTFVAGLSGITPGAYLGIDLEVVYVWSVDPTSKTAVVRRGMLGSPPDDHAADTLVYVNPLFSKWMIWKNLNIEIVSLSAADNGLFAQKSFELITKPVQKTYDVPAANVDIRQILEIRYLPPGPEKYWPLVRRRHYQMIRDVTSDDSAPSGLILRMEESFYPGRRLVVRYAGDFTELPLSLDADAAVASNLTANMLDIPALGAAARLMGVREAKRNLVERAVDSRRAQEVPSGGATRSAGVLLQLMNGRIKSEADRLRHLWPDVD